LTRLIFEDHSTQRLRWLDVLIDLQGRISGGAVTDVPGFKSLDAQRQKLVQMREVEGTIVVGVRDDDEGQFESGWVLVDSGVGYHDHGDHGHWSFRNAPSVARSCLDKAQGNPAHVYEYGDKFFVANDQLDGYTRLDPSLVGGLSSSNEGLARFIEGGGNHITLAVVDDAVGYSCWIDGGGPNKGRVDVTPLTTNPTSKLAYSFTLPSGGIHGAIANSGRVFFAPSEGICWVDVDRDASRKPEEVKVHHVSLGQSGDKPRRTGAFVSHGRYVMCVTGSGADSHLALIDSEAETPAAQLVSLGAGDGAKVVTPLVVTTSRGDLLGMCFHDHEGEAAKNDVVQIVNLDPNKDGDCSDAKPIKKLNVGLSEVDGHYGHHSMAIDADSRYGFVTNPGSGTIDVVSLERLETVATLTTGGKPTAIVARGGRSLSD
jgi:hypothetical protein